jgi:hypothetical protein
MNSLSTCRSNDLPPRCLPDVTSVGQALRPANAWCRCAGLPLGLLVCAITLLPRPALADWRDAYAEGYRLARQGQNWSTVAQKMEEAIRGNNKEGDRVVIGSANAQPYLPHFYLGLARFNLGDCRGAVESWRVSSRHLQVVRHGRENDQFNELYPVCQADVEVQRLLGDARTRREEMARLSRDADLAPRWKEDPALGPALTRTDQELAKVTADYENARKQEVRRRLGLLLAVQQSAKEAADSFQTMLAAAGTRREAIIAARRTERESQSTQTGTTASTQTGVTPPPKPDPRPPIVTGDPPPATRDTRTASVLREEAPPALKSGIELYANGRYKDALDRLQAVPSSTRWYGHVLFFRAASAFALYNSQGRRSPSLLQQAAAAVRECRALQPSLQPDNRYFSPRFVKFFREHATVTREGVRSGR